MGSEMCIRDRADQVCGDGADFVAFDGEDLLTAFAAVPGGQGAGCLLYTSAAADERSSVDLGGRRVIKKKKNDYT